MSYRCPKCASTSFVAVQRMDEWRVIDEDGGFVDYATPPKGKDSTVLVGRPRFVRCAECGTRAVET